MTGRKVLYPTDEISASEIARRQPVVPVQALNAGPARFENGPPKDWEAAHKIVERKQIHRMEIAWMHQPVPRVASHHYFALDRDARNVYFY